MADLSSLTPGTWNVDPSHSGLNFTVKHLMVSKVRGRFASFSGTLNIAADPLQSSVTAQAEVASVTTGDTGRDEHLRSGDFFEAEKFPSISFASTKIEADGDDFVLHADLTIKGVTKNVKFDLEFDGVGKDPWGNTKAGFSAEAEINRKDFGLEWNAALETGGVLVGEKVKIQLDIQAVKA
ncbi:MAG: YceI family protein [Actinomycetota bacterium]